MERICLTCPARTWNSEKSIYVCDPSIFTREPWNPNGGRRLRPGKCPEKAKVNPDPDKAMRLLRDLIKKR